MKSVIRVLICSSFLLVIALEGQEFGAKQDRAYVASDIAPLRKVIVLTPGKDFGRLSYRHYSDVVYSGLTYDDGAIKQHEDMVNIFKDSGVEVLNIIDLLEEAVAEARNKGELEKSLKEIFPSTFPLMKKWISGMDAIGLLGRTDPFFYHYDTERRLRPLARPTIWFFFTRDFAVTTPRGVIITNSKQTWRRLEHAIGRFMFAFAPSLRDCTVVFDAEREGVLCEGGDIIVKDENTILMGINNYSDAAAAKSIAKKLAMDVIGVSMPPYEDYSGVNDEIMHLDTVFNIVDKNKILTVPYLFEKKYVQANPIAETLKSANDGLRAEKETKKDESELRISLDKAIKHIPQVGWLTLFRAGTGEEVKLDKKLVDYMRELNYETVWVGGHKGDLRADKYILERVLYELSLQAANVVQLSPGKVLAYAHNKCTNDALAKHGVEVLSFHGKYLADNLGGPHCLTMPLERR